MSPGSANGVFVDVDETLDDLTGSVGYHPDAGCKLAENARIPSVLLPTACLLTSMSLNLGYNKLSSENIAFFWDESYQAGH
ncbi:hypothetical protein AVEN_6832-1 [Araneus ventricosus]|uniref:Uncharacterized protein n=1 Tax=Araneus ventricosus TaxID=182803 RepID=A0A4Y2R387_ARAVE|nr:hypothetical protein AVEN_6832-1 [Araneus ventricosus]